MVIIILSASYSFAQLAACGFQDGDGCANTDYDNSYVRSNNNATTIEYDNFVSTYHSTLVRRFDGSFVVWGEDIANDGNSNVLAPLELNSTNYPALGSAKVLKATGGSNGSGTGQFIVLASNGLYAWGNEGRIFSNNITSSRVFQKISIGGNADGLPPGVDPEDVKMLTASVNEEDDEGAMLLVTCSGDLWAIAEYDWLRGNGRSGNSSTWYRVTTNQGGNPPLTNVVAARVSGQAAIALRSDGTIWTWGRYVYIGDNSGWADRERAVQMTKPPGTIKMIGVTTEGQAEWTSYYVLMTNRRLYTLGGE